jgi:Lon protease-like protein
LGPKATTVMSSVVKVALATRLSDLEAMQQPWSAGNMRIMSTIRKDLLDEFNQQEKQNTQAETVIAIFRAEIAWKMAITVPA